MKNLRRHYRVDTQPLALRALFRHASGNDYFADVLDLSACGMRIVWTSDIAAPRPGVTLTVGLRSPHFGEPIRTLATVVQSHHGPQATELGLEIRDWLSVRATVPEALHAMFNLRATRRHRMQPACPVVIRPAELWIPGESEGDLCDVSGGGAALFLDEHAEPQLEEAGKLHLTFTLPDDEHPFELTGAVCRRVVVDGRARYSVRFVPGDSVDQRRQCTMLDEWVRQRHSWATATRPDGRRNCVL